MTFAPPMRWKPDAATGTFFNANRATVVEIDARGCCLIKMQASGLETWVTPKRLRVV